jgi:predicted DNA-binding protein (MmcQ/YjbR family)
MVVVVTSQHERIMLFAASMPRVHLSTAFGQPAARFEGTAHVLLFSRQSPDGDQISLKLCESYDYALTIAGVTPTGHGLGRHGWVTIQLDRACDDDLLYSFIDEAHELVGRTRGRVE